MLEAALNCVSKDAVLCYYSYYTYLHFLVVTVPKKKRTTVVVVETILFKLNAKLDQVEVKFVSDRQEIAFCAITGITTEIILKKPYTHIKAKLLDLAILDLNPKSIHKQV